jgi:zinc D-Ala-D-Ala carboxypeptidase
VQRLLRRCGWPLAVDGVKGPRTRRAIRDFKRGYAFRPSFRRYGWRVGPLTSRRLRKSARLGGRASAHFRFIEFASLTRGGCRGTGWIEVKKELVRGLERYRRLVGGPVAIVSGFRDPEKNRCVGGASGSQHLYGNAADVPPVLSLDRVRSLHRFSGIGIQRATGRVRHVDVRHVLPNPTGGTPQNPTIWLY